MTAPIGLSVKRREDRRLAHRPWPVRGRCAAVPSLPRGDRAEPARPRAHRGRRRASSDRAPRCRRGPTIADLPECAAAVPPLVASPRFRPYVQPAIAGPKVRHAADAVDGRYAVLPAVASLWEALRSAQRPPGSR